MGRDWPVKRPKRTFGRRGQTPCYTDGSPIHPTGGKSLNPTQSIAGYRPLPLVSVQQRMCLGRERGKGNGGRGTGNGEEGTRKREQGRGNWEQGSGNREQRKGQNSSTPRLLNFSTSRLLNSPTPRLTDRVFRNGSFMQRQRGGFTEFETRCAACYQPQPKLGQLRRAERFWSRFRSRGVQLPATIRRLISQGCPVGCCRCHFP